MTKYIALHRLEVPTHPPVRTARRALIRVDRIAGVEETSDKQGCFIGFDHEDAIRVTEGFDEVRMKLAALGLMAVIE